MSDPVKIAVVVGAAIIGATAIWIYFSPYYSCVRALHQENDQHPEIRCAALVGGRR